MILNTYAEPMGISSSPGFPITKYRVKNFKIYKVSYNKIESFESIPDSFENLISKLDAEEIKEYKFSFDPYLPHYLKN